MRKYEELSRWAIVGYSLGGAGIVMAIVGLVWMGNRPTAAPRTAPKRREPAPQRK
jgi:hypothetical protein